MWSEGQEASTLLFVTWTPPEWAFGSVLPEHEEFISALSLALPRAKIVSR